MNDVLLFELVRLLTKESNYSVPCPPFAVDINFLHHLSLEKSIKRTIKRRKTKTHLAANEIAKSKSPYEMVSCPPFAGHSHRKRIDYFHYLSLEKSLKRTIKRRKTKTHLVANEIAKSKRLHEMVSCPPFTGDINNETKTHPAAKEIVESLYNKVPHPPFNSI